MIRNLPPRCSQSRPYALKQVLTTHSLRAFLLLDTVLNRSLFLLLFSRLQSWLWVPWEGLPCWLWPWPHALTVDSGACTAVAPQERVKPSDTHSLGELWAKLTSVGYFGPKSCLPWALVLVQPTLMLSPKMSFLCWAETADDDPAASCSHHIGTRWGPTPQPS